MNTMHAVAEHGAVVHIAREMGGGRYRSVCGIPYLTRATVGEWDIIPRCRKCQDKLILDAWKSMYRDWDEGRVTSPSALDLVDAAGDVLGVTFGYDDADALQDASESGLGMIDQLRILRTRQGL